MTTAMKECYRCKQTKPLSDYNKDRKRRDGLNYICRECSRKQNRAVYARHKEWWHTRYHERGGAGEAARRYYDNPRYRQMISRCGRVRRKGRKYGVKETFTVEDFEQVFDRFRESCFNCGGQGDSLQVDHHVPQHLGTTLSHDNAVLLCNICNGTKNRQMPHEFYTKEQLASLEMLGVRSHTKIDE